MMPSPESGEQRVETIIVTGVPRSGTSLMMQILGHAGVPLLIDEDRPADASNPRGYFEYAPARGTLRDASWIDQAAGRAVKVVHALLAALPRDRRYRVLAMRRHIREVVASQNAMLARLGRAETPIPDARLGEILEEQYEAARRLLQEEACFDWIEIEHASLLGDPASEIARMIHFLGLEARVDDLAPCVDPALHRSRASAQGRARPD